MLRGTKTQTRRRRRVGEATSRHRPGTSVAIQPGRGREAIGRALVVGVEAQQLVAITPAEITAEGFADRAGFARHWIWLCDPPWREALPHAFDDELLERFTTRFADEEVWVITLAPDPGVAPRLLHRQSERGYTASPYAALEGEPEAVDALTLEAMSRRAHNVDMMRRKMDEAEENRDLAAEVDQALLALVRVRNVLARRPERQGKDELRLAILAAKRVEQQLRFSRG